jgi:hypothetical protein
VTFKQREGNRGLPWEEDHLWAFPKKPEKIYIAAAVTESSLVGKMTDVFEGCGFTVMNKWHKVDFSKKPSHGDWDNFRDWSTRWGEQDLEDLRQSDTLVVVANAASTSGGYHVELGYFLGAGRENIVAVFGRPNVFYWTSKVRWLADAKNLVAFLTDTRHGRKEA